jgi:acetylornithine/succinyldiaminopimelate/putrescine aminotransferase
LDTPERAVPALLPTYPPYPFVVARGAGDRLWDTEGNEYLDLYGGHCVCATGHAHPKVVAAIAAQAAALPFYSMAARVGVRERAAAAICAFAGMDSVFFCNSGAEANESALKVAAKLTGRSGFVAFDGGWHGRTLLALSVTDDPKLHAGLEPLLAPCTLLPFDDLEALERHDWRGVAAAIVEPIQSMAGCRTARPAWFAKLREVTARHGVVLILDEIQTGIGRLGVPFAAHRYGIRPDLITSAKGIASGVPMGALLMTAAVAAQLEAGDLGSTFGGSPLAAAALLATLEVVGEESLMANALRGEARLRRELAGTVVTGVRGAGLLLGLECGAHAKALKQHLLDKRILVGGSSDPMVLRLMPPLTLTDASLERFLDAVRAFDGKAVAA